MSTSSATRPAKQKPWRSRRAFDPTRPTLAGLIGRYILLIFVVIISVGPFLWQLSTSLKGVSEDVYSFPPHLIPQDFSVDAYRRVAHVVPIFSYAWHSVIVAAVCVIGNVVLASLAGYALTCMKFRGKKVVMGILLSVNGLLLETMSFRVYSRRRDMLQLFLMAVLENFGYRQLNTLWRCRGLWQWFSRRKHQWGVMRRSGNWGQ